MSSVLLAVSETLISTHLRMNQFRLRLVSGVTKRNSRGRSRSLPSSSIARNCRRKDDHHSSSTSTSTFMYIPSRLSSLYSPRCPTSNSNTHHDTYNSRLGLHAPAHSHHHLPSTPISVVAIANVATYTSTTPSPLSNHPTHKYNINTEPEPEPEFYLQRLSSQPNHHRCTEAHPPESVSILHPPSNRTSLPHPLFPC